MEAFEDAPGIYPPRDAHIVREVIGLLNRVQSHLLHAILIARDLLRPEAVDNVTRELFDVLESVNGLLAKIGGAPTHPTNIVIGGVRKIPTPQLINHAKETIKEVRRRFEGLRNTFQDEGMWSEKAHALAQVNPGGDVIATHPTYGNRYAVDLSKLRLVEYWAFRRVEEGAVPAISDLMKKATALIALYDGRVVEAGPRARAVRFGKVEGKGLMSIQLAGMSEVAEALERIENLLGEVIPEAPSEGEGDSVEGRERIRRLRSTQGHAHTSSRARRRGEGQGVQDSRADTVQHTPHGVQGDRAEGGARRRRPEDV